MVAHTGIAATLLINGSTVHRQFCVPVGTTGESSCRVAPDSRLEAQIRQADAIIWDEACMSDKRVYFILMHGAMIAIIFYVHLRRS
jgi:hypothetical protein